MGSAEQLVDEIEGRLQPLELELAEAWWVSNTEASDDADQRRIAAELARSALLADADAFAAIKDARAVDGADGGAHTRRRLDLLHDAFVANQIPADLRRAIVELETEVESTFNTFRGTIDGRRVDDNAIAEILRTSDDVAERRAAWDAGKQVGAEVADRVRELARLRNRAARDLGYRDHFALALQTGELNEERLFSTLADVDRATESAFTGWKRALDESIATRFRCATDELRPWHLDDPFFQDAPAAGAISLDDLFADADLVALDEPDLRRARPRRACGDGAQRSLRARRQEPARVLHRHRPRRRRPCAVQRRAERAVDGDDAA